MPSLKIIIAAMILLPTIVFAQSQTVTSCADKLVGCITCSTDFFLAVQMESKLQVCTSVNGCILVYHNNTCSSCMLGKILNITSNACINVANQRCKTVDNNGCASCLPQYQLIGTACYLNTIAYCKKLDPTTPTQCQICTAEFMTQKDCTIASTLCAEFDYTNWKCLNCNSQTLLDPSGKYCITFVPNCLVYNYQNCLQCKSGYYLSAGKCVDGSGINFYVQMLGSFTPDSGPASNVLSQLCLNQKQNQVFSGTDCKPNVANPAHCQTLVSKICTKCIIGYYLTAASTCLPCPQQFCLVCSSSNCISCQANYYLVLTQSVASVANFFDLAKGTQYTSDISKCLPCLIYNCEYCRSIYNQWNIADVVCYQCQLGYQLYNGTCLQCPNGTYYNITSKQCLSCAVKNCIYCGGLYQNGQGCQWCDENSVYDGTQCVSLKNFIFDSLIGPRNYEYLSKILTSNGNLIVNNQQTLISSCNGSSNGFSCICNSSNQLSSLCNQFTISPIPTYSPPAQPFAKADITNNLKIMMLLSQLPSFTFNYKFPATDLYTANQFTVILQICTNIIRRMSDQKKISLQIQNIFSLSSNMVNVLPLESTTILAGVGYYFKYRPANAPDNNTIISCTLPNSQKEVVYSFFSNNQVNSLGTLLSGKIYIASDDTATVNATIKQIYSLPKSTAYSLAIDGILSNNSLDTNILTSSKGFFSLQTVKINKLTATVPTLMSNYQIVGIKTNSSLDVYASERIERIFYQSSYIYILFFLCLYLILFPICIFTECTRKHNQKRKKEQSEESYQGVSRGNQQSQESVKVLRVNYRDFFPIYNIANSMRDVRLMKLSLFLVNGQHGITMLTLIYFNLPDNEDVIAIVLAIPSYLCTVILSYLCGLISLKLKGYWKYLINLWTICYWILWVALMSRFVAPKYLNFIIVFAVVFFLIDMIMDSLETLLIYFSIKQGEEQIRLFACLAKWLSYRGFYQFSDLAQEINQA